MYRFLSKSSFYRNKWHQYWIPVQGDIQVVMRKGQGSRSL